MLGRPTRWFALAESGVQCSAHGLFVGGTPILRRSAEADGADSWRVRPINDLNRELSACYRLPIDVARKSQGFEVVVRALERGDLPRAQIAALLLQFPDPATLAKAEEHDRSALAAELFGSGLLKGDWDADKHPRAGTPPNPGWFAPTDGQAASEPKGYVHTAALAFRIRSRSAEPFADDVISAQFTVTPQGFGVQQLPGRNPLDPQGLNGPISAAEQQQIADALSLIVNGNSSALNPHPYNNYPDSLTGAVLPPSTAKGYTTYDVPGSGHGRGANRLVIDNGSNETYYTNSHYRSFYPVMLLPHN